VSGTPEKHILRRIFENEMCRLRGHVLREYQIVHHTQVDTGHWSATVTEKGKQCLRCDARKDVNVERRP
jgi:hypothetical protein